MLSVDHDPLPVLCCGTRVLSFERPRIMGILNVTPDSFSDGGRYAHAAGAVMRAREMIEQGVDIIDVGGESTRPGAIPVSPDEECRRILPVIEKLASDGAVPISVDTRNPAVMRAAVAAGAVLVNDIEALNHEASLDCILTHDVAVCLMHMQGQPGHMQAYPHYPSGVEREVTDFLVERASRLEQLGVARERILIDPGFGFGKTREQNLVLLRHLNDLVKRGYSVLVGLSRKSMLVEGGLAVPATQRLGGSLAALLWAIQAGVRVVRVHDVMETKQAIDLWRQLAKESL